MPGHTITTDAVVLDRRPPSESFQQLCLFSAEHGNLVALQRVPKKPNPAHTPADLFDDASLILESSNQGRTWFVKELRILARRSEIGRSYECLRHASMLAALVQRNPVHEESREAVGRLIQTGLDAFARGVRPDVTYLKCLYLFARDEGYPVKQDWLPSLGEHEYALARQALMEPLERQTSAPGDVAVVRQSLEAYLSGQTDIVIP